jgi:ankyrin repeat protein
MNARYGPGRRPFATALLSACGSGDAEFLERWARSDAGGLTKILGADGHGAAALLHAVQCNQPECVLFLLRHRVDANAASPGGRRPLIEASRRGNMRVLRILLHHGADPNLGDTANETALKHAARGGFAEAVLCLIETGASVNLQINGSSTALLLASLKGNLEVMRLLIEADADPDLVNEHGRSPLFAALWGSHPEAAQMLLDLGADVTLAEKPSSGGKNVLMLAAREGHAHIAKRILDKVFVNGAFVNARASDGRTALMLACAAGSEPVVRLLLQQPDIDVDAQDGEHSTALLYAIPKKDPRIAEALLAHGASAKADERASTTPLVEASRYRRQGLVRLILEREREAAGLEMWGYGKKALMWACDRNFQDIAETLLQAGAAVDEPESCGRTPLTIAIQHASIGMCQMLIERGADPNKHFGDPTSRTPLEIAMDSGRKDAVKLLLDSGARLPPDDGDGDEDSDEDGGNGDEDSDEDSDEDLVFC